MRSGSLPPWLLLLVELGLALALLSALAAVLSVLWVRFWRARLSRLDGFDEVVETRTPDGATIVLARIRPVGAPSGRPPVVLCHGLAMNRHALALDPQRSLARLLAERGRDCWLLELRGASNKRHGREALGGSFDTYLSDDVPTALAYVRAATDAPLVDWVGFSMGGMLAYAHLGAMQGDGIRRLVTIGSPVRFKGYVGRRFMGAAPYVFSPFGVSMAAPLGWLASGAAPLLWPGLPVGITHGFRGHHYDAATLRRAFAAVFSNVPAGVMTEFARWVRDDTLTSDDGARDYRAALETVDVPTLVIAGDRDRLALPPCVREAYERIRATEKRYLEVGPASGAHAHYDHLDLILGVRAVDEVFVHAIDWLEKD
jgi:pimeloyl-ACP methyl ester carboxylesterase